MTQPLFLRLALGFATLALLGLSSRAASAVEINDDVFAFKGTATDIGVQRGLGQIGGIEPHRGQVRYDRSSGPDHVDGDLPQLPRRGGRKRRDGPHHRQREPGLPGALPATVRRRWMPLLSSRAAARRSRPSTRRRAGSGRRCACRSRTRRGVPVQRPTRPGLLAQVLLPGSRQPALLPADRQFPQLCGVDPWTRPTAQRRTSAPASRSTTA